MSRRSSTTERHRRIGSPSPILVALVYVGTFALADAAIPTVERDALITLYNSANGAAWWNRLNWRNPDDTDFNDAGTECGWYGVTCNGGETSVVQLDLHGNNLAGAIPPELGNLSGLRWLVLHSNQLSGSIPSELGNLSSLEALNLYSNQLSGRIPPELGNLSSLGGLALTLNQLSGSIPPELGNLRRLEGLLLDENRLSGSIPPVLGNLIILETLNLGSNELSGSIPPELGNLSGLRWLVLHSNQLSGSIPSELGNLSSLEVLNLYSNQLSGSIPPELGNLSSLGGLALTLNQLSGSIPPELGNLRRLEGLLLGSNQLSGEIPSELQNLSFLMSTDIGYNALWTEDPALQAFLNTEDPDWDQTQTIAPTDLAAASPTAQPVQLSWTPILYTGDTGGYRVSCTTTPGGPYTYHGMTTNKLATGFAVEGLQSGTTHHFIVETQTDPHIMNRNTVISEPSGEVQLRIPGTPIPVLRPIGVVVLLIALLVAGMWMLRSRHAQNCY